MRNVLRAAARRCTANAVQNLNPPIYWRGRRTWARARAGARTGHHCDRGPCIRIEHGASRTTGLIFADLKGFRVLGACATNQIRIREISRARSVARLGACTDTRWEAREGYTAERSIISVAIGTLDWTCRFAYKADEGKPGCASKRVLGFVDMLISETKVSQSLKEFRNSRSVPTTTQSSP